MSKKTEKGPGYLVLLAFTALRFLTTVAFGSIAGYMVIGGLVGMIGLLLGLDALVQYAPPVGWLLGAAVGVGNEIPRLRKARIEEKSGSDESSSEEDGSVAKNRPSFGSSRRWPTLSQLGKSLGICSVIGLFGGLMLSVFLSLLLISVTTSPFVPNSWRPGVASFSDEDWDVRERQDRDSSGVGSSFTHPLLGPIFLTSTVSLLTIGLVAGVVTAFFPDESSNA